MWCCYPVSIDMPDVIFEGLMGAVGLTVTGDKTKDLRSLNFAVWQKTIEATTRANRGKPVVPWIAYPGFTVNLPSFGASYTLTVDDLILLLKMCRDNGINDFLMWNNSNSPKNNDTAVFDRLVTVIDAINNYAAPPPPKQNKHGRGGGYDPRMGTKITQFDGNIPL